MSTKKKIIEEDINSNKMATKKKPAEYKPRTQEDNRVTVKLGMVGDAQVGKTSLMVKYVDGTFDEDYIQTLGFSFTTSLTRNLRNSNSTS